MGGVSRCSIEGIWRRWGEREREVFYGWGGVSGEVFCHGTTGHAEKVCDKAWVLMGGNVSWSGVRLRLRGQVNKPGGVGGGRNVLSV